MGFRFESALFFSGVFFLFLSRDGGDFNNDCKEEGKREEGQMGALSK